MSIGFRNLRQSEAAECGLVCLVVAAGLLGSRLDLTEVRRRHPASRGLSLRELVAIAGALDMSGRAVRCDLEELAELACPAILHWGLNHFVVLERADSKKVRLIDPARGPLVLTHREVSRHFTGVALELSRTPGFQKRSERSPLKLSSLFQLTPQVTGGLVHALVLSLLLQAYVVANPFYLQLAVDEAAVKGDTGLLGALAVGFALFAVFNGAAEVLRGLALQKVSSLLAWDMTRRLFHHMVRLPLAWFQRRKLADALSRFESLNPVKSLIGNGLLGAVIDGALSIVTLGMMLVFSLPLAAVAVAGLLLYVVVRLVAIPLSMRLGASALAASINEQGKRLETLRAMQTIKVMGAEAEREGVWANSLAETLRANQTNGIAAMSFSALQKLLDALALTAIVYLGALAVMQGKMTVGVLFAFTAYRTQFSARTQSLFEQIVNWRLLDLHTHRLADIALNPVEKGIERTTVGLPELTGRIEAANLTFTYAAHEAPVLRGVNLTIEPGEFVAIVGRSGAGKSTLLKLLCGLYTPSGGEVRIDGMPLSAWGPNAIRRSLGVVMQDDELLSGSIAENVAFFDEHIDMEKVWACLRAAAVDEEVRAMPMQAETFGGDMGSSLSGGQKQRVLLARALYRDPKILILDEATSHLDVARERAINAGLKALAITRVVVAHRPETIAAADRTILLNAKGEPTEADDGRLPPALLEALGKFRPEPA